MKFASSSEAVSRYSDCAPARLRVPLGASVQIPCVVVLSGNLLILDPSVMPSAPTGMTPLSSVPEILLPDVLGKPRLVVAAMMEDVIEDPGARRVKRSAPSTPPVPVLPSRASLVSTRVA